MKKHARFTNVTVLWAGMKIAYLVSWLIMTKIVLNLENDSSFPIKSIEIDFYGYLGIESCLRNL